MKKSLCVFTVIVSAIISFGFTSMAFADSEEKDVIEAGEVIVTANRYEETPSSVPASVTVITEKDIENTKQQLMLTLIEDKIQIAGDEAIDLIVIATHGESAFHHLLFGSVAEKVIRRVPCPVLIARLTTPSIIQSAPKERTAIQMTIWLRKMLKTSLKTDGFISIIPTKCGF